MREEERGVTQQEWITRWRQSHTPCSIHHQREQPQHEAERKATSHRGGWLSNTGVDGARITCVRCVRHRVELIEMHDRLFDFQSADRLHASSSITLRYGCPDSLCPFSHDSARGGGLVDAPAGSREAIREMGQALSQHSLVSL